MPDHLTLAELGIEDDPGTSWHPRHKDGDLDDLTDDEVLEHQAKPEARTQVDAGLVLEAEDSTHSPRGVV